MEMHRQDLVDMGILPPDEPDEPFPSTLDLWLLAGIVVFIIIGAVVLFSSLDEPQPSPFQCRVDSKELRRNNATIRAHPECAKRVVS